MSIMAHIHTSSLLFILYNVYDYVYILYIKTDYDFITCYSWTQLILQVCFNTLTIQLQDSH